MAHKDPVTPAMREMILKRDGNCVAFLVDPQEWGKCSGRLTIEHVKENLRMGRRAPSDEYHLVTLCEGHTENGARAGHQWNTTKRARSLIREYLAGLHDVDLRDGRRDDQDGQDREWE